ncbi:MAG: SpoIIE family protein phosphatase [Acidobacteria bacterium]|nr:SpoIIE family protein phosphatase [Acidobacteriota bacterium]
MLALAVSESSQVAEARREAVALASNLGFNETEAGKIAIVVTEAATNLVKHATGGQVLLRALERDGISGMEMLALDKGPGIANLGECLRDGHSTAGSAGTGLGAIIRLAALFNIHSRPGVGTAVLARFWSRPPKANSSSRLEIGAVCLPQPGEQICGDGWEISQSADRYSIMIADGLGHGPLAGEAAREAIRVFQQNSERSPAEIIEAAHAALRSTRGAAVALAEVDLVKRVIQFAGVGNIAGVVLSVGKNQNLVSLNGTVGHEVRQIREFTYPWPEEALLILHSDGLATHRSLERYPGLALKHPSLIAGMLYRDHNRGRDDVAVVVAKQH